MKSNKLNKEKKLTKGPNNKEPQSINFSNALSEISQTIDSRIGNMTTKNKTDIELLQSLKIGRKKCWQKLTKYLEQLHRQFKVTTINNTSNSFTFISKKFYATKLLAEVGLNSDTTNKKYSQVQISKEEIVKTNITNCEKCSIHVNDKTLSIMYSLPKMQKTSISTRFIVPFKACSIKPLCDSASKVSKTMYNYVDCGFFKKYGLYKMHSESLIH